MSDHLFFVGAQPYRIRTVGDAVLVQCIHCERFSRAPHSLEVGPEGPTLVPEHPWPAEIVCGYPECRWAFVVWRGNGYDHTPRRSA